MCLPVFLFRIKHYSLSILEKINKEGKNRIIVVVNNLNKFSKLTGQLNCKFAIIASNKNMLNVMKIIRKETLFDDKFNRYFFVK